MITYSNKEVTNYLDKLTSTLKEPNSADRERKLKELEKIHNNSRVLQDKEFIVKVINERVSKDD